MSDCPCCSNLLLRKLRSHQVVWFCRHCWQEMPNVSAMTGTISHHSRQVSRPTLVPQFTTLSSLQHHPLAAAYLTPSMPGMTTVLTIVPHSATPVTPAPIASMSLVPDSSLRPALATA